MCVMILRTTNGETFRESKLCDEVFNEIPTSDFIAMGYISENKVPLENT